MRGRARLLSWAGVGFCLFGATAGRARAVELSVRLRYVAGPACPDPASFKTVVAARLGYDPFRDDAPDHVVVRIAPREGELGGRIEWRDAQGKWAGDQNFPPGKADCSRLARAMGLALAVQIQLLAAMRAGSPAEAPVVSAPPDPVPPAPVPQPPRAPAPVPAPEPPVLPVVTDAVAPPAPATAGPTFALGVGPSLGIGMSSGPVALGRVFGAVVWPRVSLELGAQASLPTTTRREGDGAGFSQRLMLITASGCAGGARWNGCLVMGAGAVSMVGKDIDLATSALVPIVSAGARIGLTQNLGHRAFLYAHADGMTNVIRWTAELDYVAVWTAPRFAAALGIDAGIRLP